MTDTQPNYPIHDVSQWEVVGDEMMGTKPKCWLRSPANELWLFKRKYRPHSDDDCSEKVACELGGLLGIPHAVVELTLRHGQRGIITRDLVAECRAEELIHGNSLLVEADPAYPTGEYYHVANHTIERIFAALAARSTRLPPGAGFGPAVSDARDLFTGYLLFDAWIGNTDRHHENWGILRLPGDGYALSPSYDHASSLGHNIQDDERDERLTTKDRNRQVTAFAAKARSAIFRTETDTKAVRTDEAFCIAAEHCRPAAVYWLDCLRHVIEDGATDILRRVPDGIMSEHAKRFVDQMLRANRARLLALTI
jgi:hypothetical protein